MLTNVRLGYIDKVSLINDIDLFNIINRNLIEKNHFHLVLLNLDLFLQGFTDKELKKIINTADLVLPIDDRIIKSVKFLYSKNESYPSHDGLVLSLFRRYEKTNYSFLFLGGYDYYNRKAMTNIKIGFNDIRILGSHPITLLKYMDKELSETVRKTQANFVFVSIGTGKDEKWIRFHRSKLMHSICIGIKNDINTFGGKKNSSFMTRINQIPKAFLLKLLLIYYKFSKKTNIEEVYIKDDEIAQLGVLQDNIREI